MMFAAVLITLAGSSILGVLAFFIAKEAPKGQYRSMSYKSMPGIRTPNTLSSHEAWVAAHTAMSPYFTLLSFYFSASGALAMIPIFLKPEIWEPVLASLILTGVAIMAFIGYRGDRVAAKFISEQKRDQ